MPWHNELSRRAFIQSAVAAVGLTALATRLAFARDQQRSATLVALCPDPDHQRRIREALPPACALIFAASVQEAQTQVRQVQRPVVVTDLTDAYGRSTIDFVRQLKRGDRVPPVILYCRIAPETSRDVLEFARAGADDLVLCGVGDLRTTLRDVVSSVHDQVQT